MKRITAKETIKKLKPIAKSFHLTLSIPKQFKKAVKINEHIENKVKALVYISGI